MNKPNVVAVIQARMRSSRLPGKVLMPLREKPVLWHVVHRLRKCRSVDKIVVATSDSPADDPIEEFCLRENIEVVRGSEDNVLERYVLAAEKTAADIIVRVTGDAPLVDPEFLDNLVDNLIETGAGYCAVDPGASCIHEGFSPFTLRALRKLAAEAAEDRLAREHITAYFKNNPGFVPVTYIPVDQDFRFSGARMSVDTPPDLRFLEEVYQRLDVPAGEADTREIVRLLRADSSLLGINSHVQRKDAAHRSRRVLLRCDGNSRIGLGHVYRCLALAEELRDGQGFGVSFAVADDGEAVRLASRAGYPVEIRPEGLSEDLWMGDLLDRVNPDALLLDLCSIGGIAGIQRWRDQGGFVVTIDDPGEMRLVANLAFYPQDTARQRLDWSGFSGQLYAGWEWAVLRREFGQTPAPAPHPCTTVLVTMGGSDPGGMTLKALRAIDLLADSFVTVVVLGPCFSHREDLDTFLKSSRRTYDVRADVEDMAFIMSECDLAVASFGVTAYELAAVGVPAIYLCLTREHFESAETFAREGMAVNLGRFDMVGVEEISKSIEGLLKQPSKCTLMSDRARGKVDGQGAVRIARVIAHQLAGRGTGALTIRNFSEVPPVDSMKSPATGDNAFPV